MHVRNFVTTGFVLVLSGCANLNSIHRTYQGDASKNGVSVLTVDAKQRHLLMAPEVDRRKNVTQFRICAEAAPDVFSALASSLGVNVGLGATERTAKLANSIAETAATIERTQTINLLRESMYRTCERYLSGALTKDQFIIQAARDQKSMVAVLAIEQLTGAIRAKPTIISGPATSVSVIDGAEAAKLIERFQTEEAAAKTNLAAAEKGHESAKRSGKCDSIVEKPAADGKDPTADEWTACKSAEALLAQRKEELQTATGRLDKALTLAADFVSRSNASTTAGMNEGAAHTATQPGDAALIAVAQAVENIASAPSLNEPLMFCIAYLQKDGSKEQKAVDACVAIISAQADDEQKRRQIMLGIADAASYRRSADLGIERNSFLGLLYDRIDRADVSTLATKMAAFEISAGTNFGLSAACRSREACKRAVRASDLPEAYRADQSKVEGALREWDK